MRKIIAVIIMAGLIGFYVVSILNKGTDVKDKAPKETTAVEKLSEYEKQLTDSYPETPADVMVLYDGLLALGYNGDLDDEGLQKYIKLTRMMYTDEFNAINPEDKQLEALRAEVENNKKDKINIVASNVRNVYVTQEKDGKRAEASATVEHATNKSGIKREYLLVKENEKWKINGWQAVKEDNTEE